MTNTHHLGLPFIEGSQAQKHVTHNEALRILDAIVQIGVLDADRTAPPSSPAEGDRHIVASGATGAWAGQAQAIALYEDGGWRFFAPKAGWCAWSAADGVLLVHDGAAWSGVAGGGGGGGGTGDSVAKLGVNATATAPNLLTVRSSDALFHAIAAADGGSGDMRLQIAKESASDTASVFFSDAYAGHAEFGLTGDNDFHLKVSADGTVWRDAVTFDCTTGRASFPGGGVRELLTANRTYYVRTDGSDANTGLANSAGGAFLTIQRAVDVIAATLDIAGYDVAIQVADGTYAVASQITLKNVAGFGVAGNLTIQGNAGAPGNVVISGAGHVFVADGLSSVWDIKNLKIQTTSGTGHALLAANGSSVRFGNLNFGSLNDGGHVVAVFGSTIRVLSNYTISGSAAYHWNIVYGSVATFTGITITLSGTPAFPVLGFAYISTLAAVQAHAITFVGSATGQRYNVSTNAVLFVNGAGATYLPGNSSGVSASGGLYV